MNSLEFIKDLIEFIDNSPLSYFAVKESIKILEENGYKKLREDRPWELVKNGKYYINRDDTSLIAISLGDDLKEGFDIIGSHTESPTFKIKSNPEISANSYLKLNVEVYGGMIHSTWLDRTLSIAGKVCYKENEKISYKLVNINKDLLTIPNPAIHMNRDANKGFAYNPQDHLYPIVKTIKADLGEKGFIQNLLASELDINPMDILDYDLGLYDRQKGVILNDSIYQVGRIDNLGSVHASLRALVDSTSKKTKVLILNDNEEIGSRSRTGAFSPFLKDSLKRISTKMGLSDEDYFIALANSFLISADQAHAIHPNFSSFSDPTNIVKMNEGLVIKIAANGAYTSSVESKARIINIADKLGLNIQTFHNRNDKTGGSTIGPIAASTLGIKSVDVGEPILGMHSIRETGGIKDHYDAYQIYKQFYKED